MKLFAVVMILCGGIFGCETRQENAPSSAASHDPPVAAQLGEHSLNVGMPKFCRITLYDELGNYVDGEMSTQFVFYPGDFLSLHVIQLLNGAEEDHTIIKHCWGRMELQYASGATRRFLLHPQNIRDLDEKCNWRVDTAPLLAALHEQIQAIIKDYQLRHGAVGGQ